MSIAKGQLALLTGAYSRARKSGLLETPAGRWLFTSSYNLYKRYLEDPFYALARCHPELFRGGHVLDIGANIGYTSTLFARAIDSPYRVYAFEPEEFNFSLLQQSIRSQALAGRIIPVQSAVGSEDGSVELLLNEHHHADHRVLTGQFRQSRNTSSSVSVPVTTIDTFVRENGPLHPIAFIKVDVQGYEFPVCLGMERALAKNPSTVIALEYTPSAMAELGFEPEEMLRWFQRRDYRIYSLQRNGRLAPGVSPVLDRTGYLDLLLSKAALQS
jgi:FkbM family methyltransferase